MFNKFEEYKVPCVKRDWQDYRECFKFPNNYGASVIKGLYSHGGTAGRYELAVLVFHGDNFSLCYDTPITDDVLGWQSEQDILDVLERIKNLPEADYVHDAEDQEEA